MNIRKVVGSLVLSGLALTYGCRQPGIEETAVFLMDMQQDFVEEIDPGEMARELPNYKMVLAYAEEHDMPVYRLEYAGHGKTIDALAVGKPIEKWHDNGFVGTFLDRRLRERGIENIIMMGVNASGCLLRTARDGEERGYSVMVAPSLMADPGPEENESLSRYEDMGMLYDSHEEILGRLEHASFK